MIITVITVCYPKNIVKLTYYEILVASLFKFLTHRNGILFQLLKKYFCKIIVLYHSMLKQLCLFVESLIYFMYKIKFFSRKYVMCYNKLYGQPQFKKDIDANIR